MRIKRNKSILFFLVFACLAAGAGAAASPLLEPEDPAFDEAELTPTATPRAVKEQMLERVKSAKPVASTKASTSKLVDCTKGDSLQEAIDKNPGEVTFEVRGLCNENVKIQSRRLTLRGLNPLTDGIRGVTADPPVFAALEIWYSELVRLENLSFTHTGANAAGLGLWYSLAEALNCRMTNNGSHGVHVSASSFLDASELILSDNAGHGLNVQRSSFAICLGCRLENNALRAAAANRASFFSLWDSVVTGARGLLAANGSYGDIDCLTGGSSFPCSLNVTMNAGIAVSYSTVGMYGAGPFAGQLQAFDHAQAYLYGAQQTSTGVNPAGNPRVNSVESFSSLVAEPSFETGLQSQLKGSTAIGTFSRALLLDSTTVDGTLTCGSAGDVWADAGVTGTINGCEHAPAP